MTPRRRKALRRRRWRQREERYWAAERDRWWRRMGIEGGSVEFMADQLLRVMQEVLRQTDVDNRLG